MKRILPALVWIVGVCWLQPLWAVQSLTPNAPADANAPATGAPIQSQPMANPQMPPGFPLDPQMQAYIEQLLAYWENTSSQVTHYQCNFRRWHYDHSICNYRNPQTGHLAAATISSGTIRYRQPDKGMYEVNEKYAFDGPPPAEGKDPVYIRRALDPKNYPDYPENEKWLCDGKAIFEYDYSTKRLYESRLPPEVQGEGLKNSPLPFVFGAKAVDLLDRYWIRDITPAHLKDQYWLEAWPKRASDAQAYSRIEIHLSREPFLPIAIHMYAANYDPKTNPALMAFEFEERQINGTLASLLDPFFIRPTTPLGWERVEKDLAAEAAAAAAATQNNTGAAPHVGQIPASGEGR
jgi:TIGR03009 family protein